MTCGLWKAGGTSLVPSLHRSWERRWKATRAPVVLMMNRKIAPNHSQLTWRWSLVSAKDPFKEISYTRANNNAGTGRF
jgi:hypothetical protein